jgi:hypothetical protein
MQKFLICSIKVDYLRVNIVRGMLLLKVKKARLIKS